MEIHLAPPWPFLLGFLHPWPFFLFLHSWLSCPCFPGSRALDLAVFQAPVLPHLLQALFQTFGLVKVSFSTACWRIGCCSSSLALLLLLGLLLLLDLLLLLGFLFWLCFKPPFLPFPFPFLFPLPFSCASSSSELSYHQSFHPYQVLLHGQSHGVAFFLKPPRVFVAC